MGDSNYERWAQLVDLEAVGERLSPEEGEFCRRFQSQHPACQEELDFWKAMANLEAKPDHETRALVDAALQKVSQEPSQQQDEDDSDGEIAVYARRPAKKWLAAGAAGALVAGACAAAVLLLNLGRLGDEKATTAVEQGPFRIELVFASGEVEVGEKTVSVGHALLSEGDTLKVVRGSACLALDPGIDVCVGERSSVRIAKTGPEEQRLNLLAGKLTAVLDPQPQGRRFSVVAADVWVKATGTAFTVEMAPGREEVRATVLAGEVTVGDKSSGRKVRANHRAVARGSRTHVAAVGRAEQARHWASIRNRDLWQGPDTTILDLQEAPPGASVLLDGRPIGQAPLTTLIPLGNHNLELRVGRKTVLQSPLSAKAGLTTLYAPDPTPVEPAQADTEIEEMVEQPMPTPRGGLAQVEADRRPVKPSGVSPTRFLMAARKLMQSGQWSEAASAYRELLHNYPYSPEARAALVPLGKLELNHLRRPEVARKHFERYLQRGGPLEQEARHALIKTIRSLGDKHQEAEAVQEFLRRHPESFEARALRKRLRVLQGDER